MPAGKLRVGGLFLLPDDLLGRSTDDVSDIPIEHQPFQIGVVDTAEQREAHINGCAGVVRQRPCYGYTLLFPSRQLEGQMLVSLNEFYPVKKLFGTFRSFSRRESCHLHGK